MKKAAAKYSLLPRPKSSLLPLILGLVLAGPAAWAANPLEKKSHKEIKKIQKEYKLDKWGKKIDKVKIKFKESKNIFYRTPSLGIQNVPYKKLMDHKEEIQEVLEYEPQIKDLQAKLTSHALAAAIIQAQGGTAQDQAALEAHLKQNEPARMRESAYLLQQLNYLKKNYHNLEADWMYFYSRKSVILTLKSYFDQHHFADNGKIYQEFVRRVRVEETRVKSDPREAKNNLAQLKNKIEIPIKDIHTLEGSLAPKHLLRGIAHFAKLDGIEFTGHQDKKISGVLQNLSTKNLKVVHFRMSQWNDLNSIMSQIGNQADRNIARLLEKDRKMKEMKNKLADLGQGNYEASEDSDESETDSGSADREASLALLNATMAKSRTKQAGTLKTTKVGSASKKLHVEVKEFDDKLHKTGKFNFNIESKAEFDRLEGGGSKISTSLYTYDAPSGRPDKNDLLQFVNDVGLISYGSSDEFISYELPRNWKPNQAVRWNKIKKKEAPKNHDRTFTYVELFMEAHKYKKGKDPLEDPHVAKTYISPNMILIFDTEGGIKRHQTFSNINSVKIQKSDLVGGEVHYKFLNYTIQGRSIHLNGIDFDIKSGKI